MTSDFKSKVYTEINLNISQQISNVTKLKYFE